MQGTCPRCGKTRTLTLSGPAMPCPSCGYTDLVVSAAPPSVPAPAEPLWGPALATCIGVSAIVFMAALLAARIASSSDEPTTEALEVCQTDEPMSLDHCEPSLLTATTPAQSLLAPSVPKATR